MDGNMNVDQNLLNNVLKFFEDHSALAFSNLHPTAMTLLVALATIEFLITWGFYFDGMKIQASVQKVIKIGAFGMLVTYWDKITESLLDFFVRAGGAASGLDFNKGPSEILNMGLKGVESILSATDSMGMTELGKCLFLYIIGALIVIAFAWIALQFLITLIEFYVTTSLATILLPFGMLQQTSFLLQRSISAVFSFAVKAMVMIFMIGLMHNYLNDLISAFTKIDKTGYESINASYLTNALNVLLLAYLTVKIPELASSMISGTPQLSAGGLMSTAKRGVAIAAASAVGAGAFAANRAAVAGSAIGQAANAYQMGGMSKGRAIGMALKTGANMEMQALKTSALGRMPTAALAMNGPSRSAATKQAIRSLGARELSKMDDATIKKNLYNYGYDGTNEATAKARYAMALGKQSFRQKGAEEQLQLLRDNGYYGGFAQRMAEYSYQQRIGQLSGTQRILNANENVNQYNSLKNILNHGQQARAKGPDVAYQS